MAANEKKDFDFFSEEMESSIDSLFKPKRAIEIDPVTNQIRELDVPPEQIFSQPQATVSPPPPQQQPTTQVAPEPPKEDSLKVLIEELKQAVLTFEWEISEKNIENLKKYVDELGARCNLDNIVAKSIYTIIQENLSFMLTNPLKIPAKGPNAIQKGLDVIFLYIEKGDDAILQLGENVTQTISLLEEVKAAFTKPSIKPEEIEVIKEEPIITPILQPIEEQKTGAEAEPELLLMEEPTSTPSVEKPSPEPEFDSFELELEKNLDSSIKPSSPPEPSPTQTLSLEPILEADTKEAKKEETVTTPKLEPILELETEPPKPVEPPPSAKVEPQPIKEEPRLVLEEVEEKKPVPPPPKPEVSPFVPPSDTFQPKTEFAPAKEIPTPKPQDNVIYNEVIGKQIKHLDDYISKLSNLESVCCGIPSLSKICLFAQTMKKDLENDKKMLSSLISGEKPTISHTTSDFGTQKFEPISIKEPPKVPSVTPEFTETNIYVTTWGGEKIGIKVNEVSFDGTLSFWYNMFYGGKITRMNEIPLKILKPWPWSKITSVLKGELLNLPEDRLSSMILPLKKSARHPLGIPQKPNIVVLYKDGKGCVLFTETTLQIKSTKDYTFYPQEEGDFVGFIQKDEEKIKIISIK